LRWEDQIESWKEMIKRSMTDIRGMIRARKLNCALTMAFPLFSQLASPSELPQPQISPAIHNTALMQESTPPDRIPRDGQLCHPETAAVKPHQTNSHDVFPSKRIGRRG
jgi:hypothetical protein